MKLDYFKNCESFNAVKAEYKKLVMNHHPDLFQNKDEKDTNNEILKNINAEFEFVSKNPQLVKTNNTDIENKFEPDFEKFKDIIEKTIQEGLLNNPDINMELCGSWLWASGKTINYAEKFRKLGFTWCRGKKMWSWKPYQAKSKFYRSKSSIDEIRNKYGSVRVKPQLSIA